MESSISISKVLLIFYILIANNYTQDLLGKQFRSFLEENRMMQHIIAFILLLVIINLFSGINNPEKLLAFSFIGYTWFILSTKLDIQWNLIIIMLLFIGFLYESSINEYEMKIEKDENLSKKIKKNIIDKDTRYKIYIGIIILIVTIIGIAFYNNKKHEQYGGGFDMQKFIFY